MTEHEPVWIGADPGGEGSFGVALLYARGRVITGTFSFVDEAIEFACKGLTGTPAAIGIDAPLWWSSGKSGLRKADDWIRRQYDLPSKNVQAVNSMWGSVLAQGMMFAARMRERFPEINITETHPKALIRAMRADYWLGALRGCVTRVTLDSKPDHERDALISAIAARDGFGGKWPRDLSIERFPSEQDPSVTWLAPIHYFWPE